MTPALEAKTPILDAADRQVGLLRVRPCKADEDPRGPPALVETPAGPAPSLQVLEDTDYYYEWMLDHGRGEHAQTLHTDIDEVFQANEDRRRGRLRPKRETGTLRGELRDDRGPIGRFELEVRSKKLDYLNEYQWMLRDITETFSDAILQRFAASSHSFDPDTGRPARSLYQRFAFLKASLARDELRDALQLIFSQPHLRWAAVEERRPPGSGLPPSSSVARQIAKPGPRIPWAEGARIGIGSLPQRMASARTVPDVDTPPNRFVRHALEHWRSVVAELGTRMDKAKDSGAVARGRCECRTLLATLDAMLEEPLMREVSRLKTFPTGNQVLQKKPGYRTVLKTFLLGELAANLTWEGGEEVYGIGKRDVATLYEYWAYLALAKILGDVTGTPLDLSTLLVATSSAVAVKLEAGSTAVVRGTFQVGETPLDIALYFNRRFRPGSSDETWTREMRPDCSLRISVERGYQPPLEPVWLHFDAKYRVEDVKGLFGDPDATAGPQPDTSGEKPNTESKRSDLLKMHAYRDAIRRSLGAFVLYPGEKTDSMRRYPRELLPGLGAFPLRPDPHGSPKGSAEISRYLSQVLELLSNRSSRQERHRYWTRRIYDRPAADPPPPPGWETSPPADLRVTLGYVRSPEHMAWIAQQRQYNLRAGTRPGAVELDSPVLDGHLLLLYPRDGAAVRAWRPAGKVSIRTKTWMHEQGYPHDPRGEAYLCLGLAEEVTDTLPSWLEAELLRQLARRTKRRIGSPVSVTWGELVHAGGPLG